MRCRTCGHNTTTPQPDCPVCGARMHSPDEMPMILPPEVAREFAEKRRTDEWRQRERRRGRLKTHAVVGAGVFAGFAVLVKVVLYFALGAASIIAGRVTGPSGEQVLWDFFVTTAAAAVFGAVTGLVTSARNGGLRGGGLTGAGLWAFWLTAINLRAIIGQPLFLIGTVLVGGGAGLIPGLLVGFHVSQDSA